MSVAAQTRRRPASRAGRPVYPTRRMRGMVQKPQGRGDLAVRTDVARHPHEIITDGVKMTAVHAEFCNESLLTRAVPRRAMDREGAIMIMGVADGVCFRLGRSNPQK